MRTATFMDDKLYHYLRSHEEVNRFFMALPDDLQAAMSGQAEVTPQTKPYLAYINLLMDSENDGPTFA